MHIGVKGGLDNMPSCVFTYNYASKIYIFLFERHPICNSRIFKSCSKWKQYKRQQLSHLRHLWKIKKFMLFPESINKVAWWASLNNRCQLCRAATENVLFLCSERPDFTSEWKAEHHLSADLKDQWGSCPIDILDPGHFRFHPVTDNWFFTFKLLKDLSCCWVF